MPATFILRLYFPTRSLQVDSHADFLDEEDDDNAEDSDKSQQNATAGSETPLPQTKPTKQKRLTSKSTPAPGNSLDMLDACLPEEPSGLVVTPAAAAISPASSISPWLRQALFAGDDEPCRGAVVDGSTASPLTARLSPLAQRMRSLLLRGVYARRRRAGKANGKGGGWADGGRPAGFVGAGLAEELCLAVFGRIQGLRAQGVGKQVGFGLCFLSVHRSPSLLVVVVVTVFAAIVSRFPLKSPFMCPYIAQKP